MLAIFSGMKALYSALTSLANAYLAWSKINTSKRTKLALLYLECQRNRSILETANWEEVDEQGYQLLPLAKALETECLESVWLDGVNGDDSFLQTLGALPMPGEDDAGESAEHPSTQTPIAAACFLYQKVTVVKALAKQDLMAPGLTRISFRKRLRNIQKSYVTLAGALRNHPDIRDSQWIGKADKAH